MGEPPHERTFPEVTKMNEEESVIVDRGIVVPESPLLSREKAKKYGSVPGLDDEELADPAELERQVIREEFGPILRLPQRQKRWGLQPAIDESGDVDWGAFATVDFERTRPEFDKARYKAEKLREELRDALIILDIVKERLPGKAKYRVLKYLRMGVIDFEDIASDDMRDIARLYLRVRRLQREIGEATEASSRWRLG